MDEQVIDDLFQRAVSNGYKKSREEFVKLLHSDDEVFSDMYSYVKAQGYKKTPDDFSVLVGKKKGGMASALAPTLSVSPTKTPKFVEQQISSITPELIGMEEESVVPQMNYQFGNLGFKFEETGVGDYMNVTAPNGKKLQVSLDPFSSSKESSESKALQQFIRENTASIPNLTTLEKEYTAANKKFTTQKEVDDSITKYNQEENAYRVKSQELLKKMNEIEAERKEIERVPQTLRSTPEFQKRFNTYVANAQQFQEDAKAMAKTEQDIRTKSEQLNAAIGKYSTMKAEQGTWLGGVWNKMLTGASRVSSTAASLMTDLLVEVLPKDMLMNREEYRKAVIDKAAARGIKPPAKSLGLLKSEEEYTTWYNSLSEDVRDAINNEIEDESKKEIKYGKKDELTGKRKEGMLEDIRKGNRVLIGDKNTTPEWEDLKSQSFWGGAVLGLAESVPAMIGGRGPVGWAQRTAQMYAQVSDNLNEEMSDNPEFENISESEKLLVSAPIGVAVGVLEAYGLRNVIANKGLLNGLVVKALNKAGTTVTAKSFGDLVKNEIESGVARGTLTLVGGALAEAETGAAQELAETGLKDVYNAVKGKEMFVTPESISEYVKNVAYAGAQEAVGGLIIGSMPAAAAAYRKKGFVGMSDAEFGLFESSANDTRIEKAFVASLKNSVNTGEMTMEEAKTTLNDYRNAVGLFNSLPENLDMKGKKEAMNLLKEKRDLERQIDGKDEALTVPQRERIKAINEQLTKISQDALTKREAAATGIPEEILALKDEEEVSFNVKSLEDIPEEFRDRAVKKEGMEVEMREKILGLPIGKKTTVTVGDGYTYSITGKEAKDYAIQKQAAGEVSVQPTPGDSEALAQGEPQPKPEGVTEESIEAEVPKEKVAPIDFSTQLEQKYGVKVDLLGSLDKGNLTLSRIVIPEEQRGTGIGTQVMEEIIKYADDNGVKVTLTPSIDFGGESVARLTDFYKRFGFVENKGENKDFTIKDTMYREPQVSSKTQEEVGIPEDLMNVDTTDKTNLQKVYDFLDKLDTDLDKFGRETAGMNLALPVVKAIIKTVKALVATGITLQEAIRRAAAQNNVSEQDVVDSIKSFTEQRAMQAKPEGVTEMELPGFNRMVGELEGVIEKSRQRGVDEEGTMNNAIAYLQGSKVYEDASDTQREQMVRNVRKMFGKREKAAPKPEKLFGEVKDVKQITMSEYELLKKQLRDTAKGARNAISLWRKTANALTSYLKKMVDGGHISMKQSTSVLRKFAGVNLFDEKSIERFVDYMQKVFKNAAYAAKKNIQNKLGTSKSLIPVLGQLFAINPTMIPDSVFKKYVALVEMMGQRKAVLELAEYGKVLDAAEDILNAVSEESLKAEELAEIFNNYENKVVDEDGKVNFAETLNRMLDEGILKQADAEIMRKYKDVILPRAPREKKSEAEIAAEKEVLVEAVKEAEIDFDGLSMLDERNKARELQKLIKTDGVKGLDNAQLNNLLRAIDNINNGYFPHYAELMIEKINSVNRANPFIGAIKTAKLLPISAIYSKLKSKLTKGDAITELIRRNPLYYIDQVFGNFKTKTIFNSIFEAVADAESQFKKAVKELNNKLEKAETEVAKSFGFNANETLKSKFKMMTYLIQLEYESNPGDSQVHPASKFLKKTIDHINRAKSSFGERDAEFLQEILDKYGEVVGKDEKGNDIIEINNEKLYKSFNVAEKKAIKTIQEINEANTDRAIYTATVLRGDKIHPLNNYVHRNVLHEFRPEETASGPAFVDEYSAALKPSTKAKSLIARTNAVSALNFDVFASASRGAKFLMMDYYLTEPIRTARKTINEARNISEEEKLPKKQTDILNAVDNAFEEAVTNLLTENFTSTSIGEDFVNFISKQGYRAVLASAPRFIGELSSNIAFAMIAAPKDFKAGYNYRGVVLSPNAATIMSNVGSKQINRLFPHDTLSGRLIDTSILNQASGVRGGRAKGDVANKIQQIYNLSLKKYQNSVEVMADALIATPDKMVMRPMWFGSFANEFKKITGKEIDFEKVAANDEKYMAANKEALDAARNMADEKTVLTGASDNAFMGILKGTPKANQSGFIKAFNLFNNFMTRFLIYEYITARTGIMAAMGNGSISRKQGIALLGAVTTRMTAYTLITQTLSNALVGLFVPDEDEDDEKSLLQKVGQSLASSFTSLLLGRDFGNATKALINQGVEYVNEEYLDFLREGDYDPYKDAIQYTIMPPERKGKKASYQDLIMNMMGPFGPSIKTGELLFRKATEEPKKEQAAIDRVAAEKEIRIPLEILGNLGMIPLYKDVRKIVNAQIYKDLDKADKKSDEPMMKESDMKRYYPDLWKELYGPGSAGYDERQLKKEMQKEKSELNRQIKDEMYNYQPKKKSGFGSKGFGEKKFGEQKKSKSTFGSAKFGSK
jgi:GNAT superfamily N-acetyltransferase